MKVKISKHSYNPKHIKFSIGNLVYDEAYKEQWGVGTIKKMGHKIIVLYSHGEELYNSWNAHQMIIKI